MINAIPGLIQRKTRRDWRRPSLFGTEDFRRPDYLADSLKAALPKYRKGVFRLAMGMGMGKTVFVRALDPAGGARGATIELGDTTVRVRFFDDAPLCSPQVFMRSVVELLNRDANGALISREVDAGLSILAMRDTGAAKATADLLKTIHEVYAQRFWTSRLLFVLDGLEELTAEGAKAVLDFLPAPDELPDGVYILLTTRLDEELPRDFRAALAGKALTETMTVDRNDDGYLRLVRGYAQERILDGLGLAGTVGIDALMERAEARFLYVRLYRDFLKSYGRNRIGKLPEASELLERYLQRLRQLYGESFYGKAVVLLAALAASYEPLTMQELADLTHGTARLPILDLRGRFSGLLTFERGSRGDFVSLHAIWKTALKRLWKETVRELVASWMEKCVAPDGDAPDAEAEGRSYLLSRMGEYARDADRWGRSVAERLLELGGATGEDTGADIDIERRFRMVDFAVKLCERLGGKGEDVLLLLARAYAERGKVFSEMQDLHGALEDYGRAIGLAGKPDAAGWMRDPELLAELYALRGDAASEFYADESVFGDYDHAAKILEKRIPHPELLDCADEYKIHEVKGNLPKIVDLRRVARVFAMANDAGRFRHPDVSAKLYLYDGMQVEGHDAAKNSGLAIGIWERLCSSAQSVYRNRLAIAYLVRGNAYMQMGQPEDALADFTRAIDIRERLLAEGVLLDRFDLIDAYRYLQTWHERAGDGWGAIGDALRQERLWNPEVPAQNASIDLRERVSDSIFGRREWVYLSEEEKRRLRFRKADEVHDSAMDLSAFEVKRYRLSFFTHATMLEIYGIGRRAGEGPFWYLEEEKRSYWLGGRGFATYNDHLKVALTPENGIDYIRYHLLFNHGPNGPCFILDDLDHPALDRSRLDGSTLAAAAGEIRPPERLSDFRYEVCLLYGNALLKATFRLDPKIVRLGYTVLAEGLPVNRLISGYGIVSFDHAPYPYSLDQETEAP